MLDFDRSLGWRALEELNLSPQLAFEALFIRISRELYA